MKKYENIGIDANRDMFWLGVDGSYKRLKYLAVGFAFAAFLMAQAPLIAGMIQSVL